MEQEGMGIDNCGKFPHNTTVTVTSQCRLKCKSRDILGYRYIFSCKVRGVVWCWRHHPPTS